MFGTVIIDAYKQTETREIADALEELCAPTDSYGWASAGIYCYWDYYTRETLYIGLASDLAVRFKQHNGILPLKSGSKQKRIEEYFAIHDGGKLGFSIFVQSPLAQPLVSRNRSTYGSFAKQYGAPVVDLLSDQGINDIKRVEGILIEAYRQATGHFPLWNRVGGSITGQKRVMTRNINIVKAFSHPEFVSISPITSRSSLRELSDNPTYERYESFLHGARQLIFSLGMEYDRAIDFVARSDILGTIDEMRENGYLEKQLSV